MNLFVIFRMMRHILIIMCEKLSHKLLLRRKIRIFLVVDKMILWVPILLVWKWRHWVIFMVLIICVDPSFRRKGIWVWMITLIIIMWICIFREKSFVWHCCLVINSWYFFWLCIYLSLMPISQFFYLLKFRCRWLCSL